ncbi:MAG TPA: glycosyltransferase family 4 protein, partial [Solirubrobacter sp.]|nr:glycosyltransferase family 4 protein [Solirubrobacter sp.]
CADPGVPVWGAKGASVHVQEVVRALRRRGAAVELLAMRRGGDPPADLGDVPLHRLPRPRGEPAARERAWMGAGAAVVRALDALGPVDLVYERCSLFGEAAMAWAARRGVPGVLEVNAPLVDEHARHRGLVHRAAAEAAVRAALRDATAAIAVSEPVAAWARARAADPARVHVVANGVDVERIRPVPRAAGGRGVGVERVRPAPAARGGRLTVGFVGTLKPWHGIETLVEAFGRLDRDWRLLVVGDGPRAAVLRERARRLGVAGRVECTGANAHAAVPAQLARMDIAVAPYPADDGGYCSPLKLFEYLAAGLPIVASRTGAVTSVLRDGHDGVLVPPGDPGALAAALADLRADPARRAALGRAARRTAVRGHCWQAAVDRILACV